MNVDPKEFYKRAAEERAEEAKDERREAVARAERTKCGYPRPPNWSVGFAKKLKVRR